MRHNKRGFFVLASDGLIFSIGWYGSVTLHAHAIEMNTEVWRGCRTHYTEKKANKRESLSLTKEISYSNILIL